MATKLSSRKFWMCAAAFLASLGSGIAGLATDNGALAMAGAVCTVLSCSIYAACEAYVDGRNSTSTHNFVETTTTNTTEVSATTDSADVVDRLTAPAEDTKVGGTE